MSTPLKALVAVAGVGTVSTGVYFAIPSRKGLSIRERLGKAKYSILNLDKGDKTRLEDWNKVKAAYDKENNPSLKFSKASDVDEIKDACDSLLSSESEASEDLEKARRWCVVPVTVASRIGDNLILLDTTTTNADDGLWASNLVEHKKDNPKFSKIPNAWGAGDNDDPKKTTALKNKCSEMSKLHSFDKDFEAFVSYTQNWCTKSKS